MAFEALGVRLELSVAVAIVMVGAVMALASGNIIKRVAGAMVTQIGAVLACGVILGGDLLVVGVAVMMSTLAIGLGLIVRFQERYRSVELSVTDAAEADAEPIETNPS